MLVVVVGSVALRAARWPLFKVIKFFGNRAAKKGGICLAASYDLLGIAEIISVKCLFLSELAFPIRCKRQVDRLR